MKKLILLPLLLIYCSLMFVASWPNSLQIEAVREPVKQAKSLFKKAHIRASAAVFQGNGGDWKRKNQAIFVIGLTRNYQQKTIYSSYNGLHDLALRIKNQDFDTTLKRMLGTDYQHRLAKPNSLSGVLSRSKKDRRFNLVSKFFCESDLINNQDLENIYIVWFFQRVSYSSGEVENLTEVMHSYSCTNGRTFLNPTPRAKWNPLSKKMELS